MQMRMSNGLQVSAMPSVDILQDREFNESGISKYMEDHSLEFDE